jgi:hypothetical protein
MLNRSKLLGVALVVLAASVLMVVGIALAALPPGGTFIDDNGNVHEANIEAIAAEGITKGCNPPTNNRYCPDSSVTRGQMAAFLRRAFNLQPSSIDFFVDDNDSIFEADINSVAMAGITRGCNPPANSRFCPDGKVTRGQMAAFLRRTFGYPAASTDYFTDDNGSIFEADINAIAKAGVTKGCNPPTNNQYCPSALVRRDQMASFLARALGLTPINPPPPPTTPPPTTPPPTTPPPTTPPPTTPPPTTPPPTTPPQHAPVVSVTASGSGLIASWQAIDRADGYDAEYRISAPSTSQIPDYRLSPLIIGGSSASIDQYPWQVAILAASITDSYQAQFCGGSLIAPDWVLTAAHCVDDPLGLEIGYGKTKLSDMGFANRIGVAQIVTHPLWSRNTTQPGDVALLRLEQPVPGGKPIGLPREITGLGARTWASGWGNTDPFAPSSGYPDTLQSVKLDVLAGPTDTTCAAWGSTVYHGLYHLCAGVQHEWAGSCFGDSGGPLATVTNDRWQIAGVTSFGSSPSGDGCSHPDLPTIFSRVSAYSTWVSSYSPETDWVALGSTTGTSVTISPLVPGYHYDVRVRATNYVGAGSWSDVATGLVAGSVPPPVGP